MFTFSLLKVFLVCSQVISYNCLDEVCPLENTELTCHIMGNGMRWYAPSGNQLGAIFALVPSTHTFTQSGYTGTFINYTSVSGMWIMLSFTATTDKNATQVRCFDGINAASMTCTIMISGMSLTVSYITNMYYHYKILQVMFLQDWVLQLSQTHQSLFTGHLLLFILTV